MCTFSMVPCETFSLIRQFSSDQMGRLCLKLKNLSAHYEPEMQKRAQNAPLSSSRVKYTLLHFNTKKTSEQNKPSPQTHTAKLHR